MQKNLNLRAVFLSVLLTAAVLCLAPVSADALTSGDYEYTLANSEVTITKYTGSDANVVIPSTISGCRVVAIYNNAFSTNTTKQQLTSVVIPDTVKTIGNSAFINCGNLTSVVIPDSVTSIGSKAFMSTGLTSLKIPASAANGLGEGCFCYCRSLETISLPEGMTSIPDDGFSSCSALERITLPSTVTAIKPLAFVYCNALTSITIPASVTDIGDSAFRSCEKLASVTFEEGSKLASIGERAFVGCAFRDIYLPNTVTRLAADCFENCKNLRGFIVPPNVKSFSFCLGGCTGLQYCVVPSTVTSAGIDALSNCIYYVTTGSAAEKACIRVSANYINDTSADAPIQVIYNGDRISFGAYGQDPTIINNRTMVPLRSIFESMGATVDWNDATRTVTAVRGKTTISITVGSNTVYVNGRAVSVDSPATIRNNRTLVPVRVIAESFGADVGWVGNSKLVLISE